MAGWFFDPEFFDPDYPGALPSCGRRMMDDRAEGSPPEPPEEREPYVDPYTPQDMQMSPSYGTSLMDAFQGDAGLPVTGDLDGGTAKRIAELAGG